jgi:hypothetical protein
MTHCKKIPFYSYSFSPLALLLTTSTESETSGLRPRAYRRELGWAELRRAGGGKLGSVRVSSRGIRERRIRVHRWLQTDDDYGERALDVLKLQRGARSTQESSRNMTEGSVGGDDGRGRSTTSDATGVNGVGSTWGRLRQERAGEVSHPRFRDPGVNIITRCAGTKSHTFGESWYRNECHNFIIQ